MPRKQEEGDVEVDRFVQKVLLDMEDEDFTEQQKVMVVDLLCENIIDTS